MIQPISSINTSHVLLPDRNRNYIVPNRQKTDFFVRTGKYSLPVLKRVLEKSDDEAKITEALYILNMMLDNGTKNIDKMYPVLSRFNQTQSPNIQTFLAGIYRKIQVPDAFGPLVRMLIQNSAKTEVHPYFDPNEEIGGAILSYLSDRFRK